MFLLFGEGVKRLNEISVLEFNFSLVAIELSFV